MPERYVWQAGETPIFTNLLHRARLGYEQNERLWDAWDLAMYRKYASSGVCYCGADMDDHDPYVDNHAPREMMYY